MQLDDVWLLLASLLLGLWGRGRLRSLLKPIIDMWCWTILTGARGWPLSPNDEEDRHDPTLNPCYTAYPSLCHANLPCRNLLRNRQKDGLHLLRCSRLPNCLRSRSLPRCHHHSDHDHCWIYDACLLAIQILHRKGEQQAQSSGTH